MKNFLLLFIVALTFSCKKEVKQQEEKKEVAREVITEEEKKVKVFTIEYYMTITKNDNFQLFYMEDYRLSFNEKKSIRENVKANEKEQKLVFELPLDVIPDRLRFDLGGNRDLKEILFEKIIIKFGNEALKIDRNNFLDYLVPNDYISFSSDFGVISLKTITKDGKETYDPYLLCSPKLVEELYDF